MSFLGIYPKSLALPLALGVLLGAALPGAVAGGPTPPAAYARL